MINRKSMVDLFKLMNKHNLNAEEAIVATLVKDSHPSYEIYPLMDHLQFSMMIPKVRQMLTTLQQKGVIVAPVTTPLPQSTTKPCGGDRNHKQFNKGKHRN